MSGPLLDRIDLCVTMPRLPVSDLLDASAAEPSAAVAARIRAAWELGVARNGGIPNGVLPGWKVLGACDLDVAGRSSVSELTGALELTARGIHRMLRVARTIADLHGRERAVRADVLAAAALRERTLDPELAA